MIIGINGGIGEGKDTFTEMFIKKNPSFVNKKFAGKLKQICAILVGCKVEDFEDNDFKNSLMPHPWKHPKTGERITYRFFLQYVGTDLFRDQFDPNFWVNSLLSDYDNTQDWIISDFRFLSEAEGIKRLGGITVNIKRSMAIGEWISSKYFKGCVYEQNIYCNNVDISKVMYKNEFVDFLIQEKAFINNDQWKILTHVSERQLYEDKYKFNFTINNSSGLEDLQKSVEFFSKNLVYCK